MLKRAQKIAYGIGNSGLALVNIVIQTWLLFFLAPGTGRILIPASVVGAIWLGGRVVDALIDPPLATWSDRCRSPLGRRLPFMLWSGIPLVIVTALLFAEGGLWRLARPPRPPPRPLPWRLLLPLLGLGRPLQRPRGRPEPRQQGARGPLHLRRGLQPRGHGHSHDRLRQARGRLRAQGRRPGRGSRGGQALRGSRLPARGHHHLRARGHHLLRLEPRPPPPQDRGRRALEPLLLQGRGQRIQEQTLRGLRDRQ